MKKFFLYFLYFLFFYVVSLNFSISSFPQKIEYFTSILVFGHSNLNCGKLMFFLLRLLTIISELFKIESDISEIKFFETSFENDGNEFYEALENLQNNDEFWDEIEEEIKVEVLRLVSAFSQKLSIMLKKLLNLFQRKKKKNLLILMQNC